MSIEVELSVIGGLLLSKKESDIEGVFSKIPSACFSKDVLKALYVNFREQYRERSRLDTTIAINALGDNCRNAIVKAMELVPSPVTLPYYADLLLDSYRKRLLGQALQGIITDIEFDCDTHELMRSLNDAVTVQTKLEQAVSSTSLCFLDSIVEFLNHFNSEKNVAYKTGIHLLDYMLSGGFKPKEVSILSGRSGMGKSDMAIFLAVALALNGAKVLYFTMEMPRVQILNRIASRITKIDSAILTQKEKVTAEQMRAVTTALEKLTELPLILDEQQNLTVFDITAKVAKHKPQVVIIDHIGLMAQDKYKKQWESISENSKALKQLAMSKNISVIELVQQNSEIEKRKSKEGLLSDLKGTDALGNDADNTMFIYAQKGADTATGGDSILSGDAWVDVSLQLVKNRGGKTGTIKFHWQPQYHSYVQVESR